MAVAFPEVHDGIWRYSCGFFSGALYTPCTYNYCILILMTTREHSHDGSQPGVLPVIFSG
jgi:hypothetical protein